jgi:hypothetical protein
MLTFLREYHPPEIRFHLDLQYFLALWRSIYQLAIMGFHFRQMAELHDG